MANIPVNGSVGDIISNNQTEATNFIKEFLLPDFILNAGDLITIFKAAGIIFIAYIIFLIIKNIFDIRRNIRITKTYHTVNEIDKKLDLLLRKKGAEIKEKSQEKTQEKKEKKKKRSIFRLKKLRKK